MQVCFASTLVLTRGLDDVRAITSSHNPAQEVVHIAVAALPKRIKGHTTPRVRQQTVSEAKEVWRYEGNPN